MPYIGTVFGWQATWFGNSTGMRETCINMACYVEGKLPTTLSARSVIRKVNILECRSIYLGVDHKLLIS